MESKSKIYRDKINNFVKDIKVKDIIILGTGPSLDQGINYINSNNRDDLIIISIKQSLLKLKNYNGKIFHLVNPWNFEKYNYNKRDILRLYFHEHFAKFKPNKKYYDLFFLTDFIENHLENSQLLIMSAAVADYRVKNFSKEKIKKESMNSIELEKNPDILKEIDGNKIVKVGFAAESEKLLENAKKKLSSKNCKMIVANDITLEGSGFGSDNNKAVLIDENGQENLPLMNKIKLAHKILDRAKKYIN